MSIGRLPSHSLVLSASAARQVEEAQAPRKKLLAIGESKGYQHDSVSHGLATIWKIGATRNPRKTV